MRLAWSRMKRSKGQGVAVVVQCSSEVGWLLLQSSQDVHEGNKRVSNVFVTSMSTRGPFKNI